jgi:hypothetical protein
MIPNPAPLLPRIGGRVALPAALRKLWRIVLRWGARKALLNQRCGGVAAAGEKRARRLTHSPAAT